MYCKVYEKYFYINLEIYIFDKEKTNIQIFTES